MIFTTDEREKYTVVTFDLGDTPISPSDLGGLTPPAVDTKKGVVLNGRGPVWLYCFLAHYYHPTPFVATNDPRLGAVVVESHRKGFKVGDII